MKRNPQYQAISTGFDHPASKLQPTLSAVKDFAVKGTNQIHHGRNVARIWDRIIIRRTNSSKIGVSGSVVSCPEPRGLFSTLTLLSVIRTY